MALLYVFVQMMAVALAPLFLPEMGAFPDPDDPVNPLIYVLMLLIMTGVILLLIRYGRTGILRAVFYFAIFITLLYVFLPLLLQVELYLDPDGTGWPSLIIALALASALMYAQIKSGEWYIINIIGLIIAVGITAILGMSLGILPAIILLVIMAVYDAIAVYKTKHMVALADGVAPLRLPVLFVIPNRRDFSMDELKEKKVSRPNGGERDAFFMGVGDTVIPGILVVSASLYLPNATVPLLPAGLWVAAGTIVGGLLGYLVLMRFVMRGKPQAGLPFLNTGAILGYLASYAVVYQDLSLRALGL